MNYAGMARLLIGVATSAGATLTAPVAAMVIGGVAVVGAVSAGYFWYSDRKEAEEAKEKAASEVKSDQPQRTFEDDKAEIRAMFQGIKIDDPDTAVEPDTSQAPTEDVAETDDDEYEEILFRVKRRYGRLGHVVGSIKLKNREMQRELDRREEKSVFTIDVPDTVEEALDIAFRRRLEVISEQVAPWAGDILSVNMVMTRNSDLVRVFVKEDCHDEIFTMKGVKYIITMEDDDEGINRKAVNFFCSRELPSDRLIEYFNQLIEDRTIHNLDDEADLGRRV